MLVTRRQHDRQKITAGRLDHMRAFEEFLMYKTRVPVRGAALLNAELDSVVLVKGWKKGASWGFPRGKINKDEDDLDCAVREVYEETGYDLHAAGLIPGDRQVKWIEMNLRGQNFRLYVFRDVPMDARFEPQTRKEISSIKWWRLSDLPNFKKKGQQQHQAEAAVNANKFFVVAPFLPQLRRWVVEQKKRGAKRTTSNQYLSAGAMSHDEGLTEDDQLVDPDADFDSTAPESFERAQREEEAVAAFTSIMQAQPSNQGLQSSAGHSSGSKSSGQRLLDLLHSAPPPTSEPSPTQLSTHATVNQPIIEPSVAPPTAHYQPQRPQFPNAPLAPNYPLPQHQPPAETYAYQQPEVYVHHEQRAPAPPSYHNQAQREQHRPYPNPPALVHPQPLPPHVQKALFTGGPVHAPMVPPSIQQPSSQYHPTISDHNQIPQFPNVHATMVPPQQKPAPPALTSHSLALLNAFKNHDQPVGDHASTQHIPSRNGNRNLQALPVIPQELSADSSQPMQATISQTTVSQTTIQELNASTARQSARPPISEAQRSMLLEIFKSPNTQHARPATPPTAASLPTSSSPSAVELCAVEVVSPPASQPTDTVHRAPANHQVHHITEMSPESTIPFRPMAILTRPTSTHKAHKENQSQSGHTANRGSVGADSRPSSKKSSKTSPEKPFQPQILKRPQSGGIIAPDALMMIGSSTVTPKLGSASTTPLHLPLSSQPPPSSDQKQALLSLFGKLPAVSDSAPTTLSNYGGVSKAPDAAKNPAIKSRVGSLASGSGEVPSRRGSQTPISPADKGFLLNYLDAVASRGY
ncbi:mRNA-decapping enzyme subunit 2 [Clarireedia jacksonii]